MPDDRQKEILQKLEKTLENAKQRGERLETLLYVIGLREEVLKIHEHDLKLVRESNIPGRYVELVEMIAAPFKHHLGMLKEAERLYREVHPEREKKPSGKPPEPPNEVA